MCTDTCASKIFRELVLNAEIDTRFKSKSWGVGKGARKVQKKRIACELLNGVIILGHDHGPPCHAATCLRWLI